MLGSDVSEWSEWGDCTESCIRGTQTRARACADDILLDPDRKMCGTLSLVEYRDCLLLDNCNGSGYYLADKMASCSDFCQNKKCNSCSCYCSCRFFNLFIHIKVNKILIKVYPYQIKKWYCLYNDCHLLTTFTLSLVVATAE